MKDVKSFWQDINDMPLTFVLFFIALIGLIDFVFLIIAQIFMPAERVQIYADIFNKLAIGFGAMSAGLGGFRFLSQYFEYERMTVKKRDYMNLYPPNEFTDRYDIVNRKSKKKELYLRDKQEKTVRHIANGATYNELGWTRYKIVTLEDKDFEEYAKENRILTTGKVGE